MNTVNKSGFTMIEALCSMFIISVISILFVSSLSNIHQVINQEQDFLFLTKSINIKKDCYLTKEYYIENGDLVIEEYNGDLISYKFADNKLIRKINGAGYVVIIDRVNNLSFTNYSDGIYLENDKYKVRICE